MCVWASHPFFENLGVGITKISMGFLHGTFFFGLHPGLFLGSRFFFSGGVNFFPKKIFFSAGKKWSFKGFWVYSELSRRSLDLTKKTPYPKASEYHGGM